MTKVQQSTSTESALVASARSYSQHRITATIEMKGLDLSMATSKMHGRPQNERESLLEGVTMSIQYTAHGHNKQQTRQ